MGPLTFADAARVVSDLLVRVVARERAARPKPYAKKAVA